MSARAPLTEAVGYSHPFSSDCTVFPSVGSTMCASLLSRVLLLGEIGPSRVLRGTFRPEAIQLLVLAIASAPASDHAHGNEAMRTL